MILKLFKRDELFEAMTNDVLFFKAEGHYTSLFFNKNNKLLLPFGLSQVEEELKKLKHGSDFLKLGRSHIIHTKKVVYASITKEFFTMIDSNNNFINIKVSKTAVKHLMTVLKEEHAVSTVLTTSNGGDMVITTKSSKQSGGGEKKTTANMHEGHIPQDALKPHDLRERRLTSRVVLHASYH